MEYQLPSALESHSESLALFQGPTTDSSIVSRQWVEYKPINAITEGAAIEFNITSSPSDYMNLQEYRLQIKAKLTHEDGITPVTKEDLVAPVNLSLQSLFTQVDLNLQQQPLYSVGGNYPFKAYLDVLLDENTKMQEEKLASQLYYKDNLSSEDIATPQGDNNGLYQRWTHTREGRVFDMSGPLYLDMWQQERLLLNGIPLQLKLWPSKDAFRLMSSKEGMRPNLVNIVSSSETTDLHSFTI